MVVVILILGVVLLTVSMVFLATAARKHPTMGSMERLQEIQLLRAPRSVSATVVPNRVSPPAQRVQVSLWPKPIKGEIDP